MATYTVNGQTVESNLSREEATEILRSLKSGFAQSLVSQFDSWKAGYVQYPQPWSPKQEGWAFKLAEDNKPKQNPTILMPNLGEFLFRPLSLKWPRIQFQVNDGTILFAKTSDNLFIIQFNRKTVGLVDQSGNVEIFDTMPISVKATLDEFEENPVSFVAERGKASGHCCFCSFPLTDSRSLKAGYGPICAGHYQLPWGDK